MNIGHVGKTCPFCQFPIKQDSDVVVFAECRIPHHREYWQENGGCTTFGCSDLTGGIKKYMSAGVTRNDFIKQSGIALTGSY